MSSQSRFFGESRAQDGTAYLRRAGRVPVAIDVRVSTRERAFKGTAANLGAGGLFLVADQLTPVGAELLLSFQLPEVDEELEVWAEVRWVRGDVAGQPWGMGLRFLDLAAADRGVIGEFVRAVEAQGQGQGHIA